MLAIFAALPASGAGAAQRFVDKGDGTVLDKETNLMWLKDAGTFNGPVQVANTVIIGMNAGRENSFGHKDWRIPSVDEMLSLVESGKAYPALPDGHPFENVLPGRYWTSSGGFSSTGYAWSVDLATGAARFEMTSHCNFFGLWPVRSAGKVTVRKFVPPGEPVKPGDVAFLSMRRDICSEGKSAGTPESPSAVTVTAVSPTEVMISWSSVGGGVEWFNVYSGEKLVKSSPVSPIRVSGLKPDTSNCFTVTAYSSSGLESKKSMSGCVTTWSTMALGTVWSLGLNNYGQLGDGSRNDSREFVQVRGVEGAESLSAGVEHAAAVFSDGTLWTWGRNSRGQLGDGTDQTSPRPIQVKGLKGVIQSDLGWYHSLALMKDGSVRAWGRNYYGQLGDGKNIDTQSPVKVVGISSAVQVAAGWYHSLALMKDGSVRAWGWDRNGQLGNGDDGDSDQPRNVLGISGIKEVSAGMYHSLALGKDGKVWAWGSNEFGQLGIDTSFEKEQLPVQIKGLDDVAAISCGMSYSLALKKDGTVWAWGRNDFGQIGNDKITQTAKPVMIKGLSGIRAISAGAHHAVAIDSAGSLWLWGWDYAYDNKNSPPHKVGGLKGITHAATGMHFTSVLKGK